MEQLDPEGTSINAIFETIWAAHKDAILARGREGDTEAARIASTKVSKITRTPVLFV